MADCLFCSIISGAIPSTKVYEDDLVYAFKDINPQAPVHVLILPKKHIASLAETQLLTDAELAACLRAATGIAEQLGLSDGWRLLSNCGRHACQSVAHLHFHLLGGKQLSEKMD